MRKQRSLNFILFPLLLTILFSCSERGIPDPPVLSDKWVTVYDDKAEGISREWYRNFPGGNFSGSTWDDWQIKNARYRWHRQSFMMGKADSLSLYLLKCSTVAGKNLIWLNGTLLAQLNITPLAVLDISPHLKSNSYNDLVVRSEYQTDAFGIHQMAIIKGTADSLRMETSTDYISMPLYHKAPSYLPDLIIYQADIRNMSAAGNFVGFQNTISRLDQLGVNMVWLMPLHPIGVRGRIGKLGSPYAVKDHFACNPDYGEQSDFNSLAAMLKRYKIRIMLEMVPSQSAVDHAWVTDYPDHYLPPAAAISRDIRKFNYDNNRIRTRMMSYFDYWLERGADAFHCYDSRFIPGQFWEDLRDHFAESGKEPLLMADCDDAKLMLNGFNVLQGGALYEAFLRISKNESDAGEIGKVLSRETQIYPEGTRILHYAEYHGSERAAALLGHEDHHLALFTIFTAPGIPMLYSGEELINPPRSNLYDKHEMNWFNIHWPTYNLISRLTKLRKSSPVLTRGDFSQIADTKAVGGFTRRYRNETWFVLMNYSNTEQIYQCDAKSTVFSDGVSGVTRNGRVLLQAKGYCIVK
ncbi:MAG: alpha-amylase family glycosyl hydrolase [Candidatus Neomarinimicrobiota bacterium]|jgi:glycosidase|nr:alpha-amylase family glycosyl hydrolase [Candidatus Neomarinimicrobiota bacterium]MDD3965885.1 alpha-amylase family glycosyl hydrolase [Candidatus Neomarinimicrobiota bacterium]MDX9779870.1 alpha-amylase family glycosyl hydrolase [bacterium]